MEVVKPNNTIDTNNSIYSGRGIGFDHGGTFSHPEGSIATNVIIICRADVSGSVHATNKTKDFLVLDKGPIETIEKTTIYAEKMYSNFSIEN